MAVNMYPSSSLLGQHKDANLEAIPIDELIEKADVFAEVFSGTRHLNFYSQVKANLQVFHHSIRRFTFFFHLFYAKLISSQNTNTRS